MRLLEPIAALAMAGCVSSSSSDDVPVSAGDGIEFIGVMAGQQTWYETYVREFQRTFPSARIPSLRIYGTEKPRSCPAPSCFEDDRLTVACSDVTHECARRLSAALVDQLGPSPLLLRDGLVEVLAGGVGHGDWFDDPVLRDGLDVAAMLDDATYLEARAAADELAWSRRAVWPSADLARFLLDELGGSALTALLQDATNPDAWEPLGGMDAALERWRQMPPTTGRMFRLPLVECSDRYAAALGYTELPTLLVGLVYAPHLSEPIDRVAVARFELDADTTLRVVVESAVGAHPFFRIEACGRDDVARFVRTRAEAIGTVAAGEAVMPAGRYFIVAGSDGLPASSPEPVLLKALPTP